MKKSLIILHLILVFFVANSFAEDKANHQASDTATKSFIQYYSSMNKLVPGVSSKMDYGARLLFLTQNQDLIASQILQARAFNNLGQAHQIFENLFNKKTGYLPYTHPSYKAQNQAYFDSRTGHRYIRKNNNTYVEYSQKGKVLKTLAANQAVLTKYRNVHAIHSDNYILYKKHSQGRTAYLSLPANQAHPQGWKASKLMTTLD